MTTFCLLASANEFIVAGVKALLAEDTDVEVRAIGVTVKADLVQAVAVLHPDVLILDEGIRTMPPAPLQRFLRSVPGVRVIILNHEDNELRVYQGMWSEEAPIQELAKVVHKQQPHGGPG